MSELDKNDPDLVILAQWETDQMAAVLEHIEGDIISDDILIDGYDKLPTNHYSAVISRGTLSSLNTFGMIDRSVDIYNLLKPGGSLVLSTGFILSHIKGQWLVPNSVFLFSIAELEMLFDKKMWEWVITATPAPIIPTDFDRYISDLEYRRLHKFHRVLYKDNLIWTSIFLHLRKKVIMTRKEWEVEQAFKALRDVKGTILGVGAGIENTIAKLSHTADLVIATDLYDKMDRWGIPIDPTVEDPSKFFADPINMARVQFFNMNAKELKFVDNFFDGIFSSSSIEHFGTMDDIKRAVDEMYRVLKVGGLLAISTEIILNKWSAQWLVENELRLFNESELDQLFGDGLWNVEVVSYAAFLGDEEPTDLVRYLTDEVYKKEHLDHKLLIQDGLIWTSIFLLLRKI